MPVTAPITDKTTVNAAWLVLTLAACDLDLVSVTNAPDDRAIGIMVDGVDVASGTVVDDSTYDIDAPILFLENLRSDAAGDSEVVVFTNRRPPALLDPAPWTPGRDVAKVQLSNELGLAVTVWIVKGPFDDQRARAIDACVTTSSIWNSERMGAGFSTFSIKDATGDGEADNYFDFDCSMRVDLEDDIGRDAGRINIYYVGTVDGGVGRGQACSIGSDFVAMAERTGDELLSHELGHNFDLLHINGLADFDQTNIMHNASSTRSFVTEGQLFRAHLRSGSALNDTYGARPGLPLRECAHTAANSKCPGIGKRIWADGTFPAN
ncbi:MAG: hypothetical protein JKY37_12480 [Nannocystaceae bacterium]|nr:hypothetical protein [Nannocystaceae bacterium]